MKYIQKLFKNIAITKARSTLRLDKIRKIARSSSALRELSNSLEKFPENVKAMD